MDLTKNRRPAATAPRFRALWSRLAPHRRPRPERAPDPAPAADLGGPLRAFRAAALWGVAILIATATGSAFTESYRGLFDWAEHHGLSGFWAAAFPLQVDLFIAVGELVLLVAMLDSWRRRDQAGAWLVALLGLAVSVAGNVGHIAATDLQSRGTAAVPPVAAFGALWLGLGVLKRILRRRRELPPAAVAAAAQDAPAEPAESILLGALTQLSDAFQAITERPAPEAAQTALLGELLEAVRGLGPLAGGAVPAEVPADAESAALIAMRATVAAGNPWSQRQVELRFGLSRATAAKVREAAGAADTIRYAMNGASA